MATLVAAKTGRRPALRPLRVGGRARRVLQGRAPRRRPEIWAWTRGDGELAVIEGPEQLAGEVTVYNLEVEVSHNYFAGDPAGVGAILVHNGKYPAKLYKRPSGATTKAQRAEVQGETDRQVAGHKKALVEEYYEHGTIDRCENARHRCRPAGVSDLLREGGRRDEPVLEGQEGRVGAVSDEQQEICRKYGVVYVEAPAHLKIGIAENVKSGVQPINGLRHPQENGTAGWYIWAGEEPERSPDFFVPIHISHLGEWCPQVLKFLGLPPGWRFMVDDEGLEDVWEDPSLLNI